MLIVLIPQSGWRLGRGSLASMEQASVKSLANPAEHSQPAFAVKVAVGHQEGRRAGLTTPPSVPPSGAGVVSRSHYEA